MIPQAKGHARVRWIMTLLVAIALLPAACAPSPAPAPTAGSNSSIALLSDNKVHVETASAVMPPGINSNCQGGRVFVVYGRQYGASRMASTDIKCYLASGANCFQSQSFNELSSDTFTMSNAKQWDGSGQPQNFTCNAGQTPTQTVQRHNVWYTDSLITRVGNKDLLHAYLAMANHPPKSPVKNRLNNSIPIGCNNPFTTCSLAIVKSSDCGQTWTKQNVIDLNDPAFMNGSWAVPEYDSSGVSNQKGYAIDRPEIMVDPYFPFPNKTSVFLTAAIRMGPQAGKTIVMRSLNGGDNWLSPVLLPGTNPGNGGNPTVIATTPKNRVYAFRCEGTEPRLYWSDDYGASFKDKNSATTKYQDANVGPLDCGVAAPTDIGGNVGAGSPSIGIARWGNPDVDNVIITYSAVIDKRQVQPVLLVTTVQAADPNPKITANILIQGASGHHVVQASLISTDRFEFKPDEANDPLFDASLLFWLDIASPGSGGAATARYKVVRRGLLWQNDQPLALKNGAAYNWNWNVISSNPFIGDYNRASFLFANLTGEAAAKPRLHFVSTWPESVPSATPNLLIHSNIVTWPEP